MKFSFVITERPDSFASLEHFAHALRRVKELGYDGVELHLVRSARFELNTFLRIVESTRVPVVSFLTGLNYFSEGLCLSSPQEEVRIRAVDRLKEWIEVAAQFGALLVIGQMQGSLQDEPDRALGEARIEDAMKRVAETAERHETTIAFEPVNHLQAGFNNSLRDVMDLTARIGSTHLKPMLDTFHMNIEEKSTTEPIHRAGRQLAHFHLSESNGGLFGSGHLDFEPIFEALAAVAYSRHVSTKIYRQPWEVGAETSIRFIESLRVARR